ncbi:MAG: hypothetical protein IMF18_06375 [Proteobacteria bacterium]|nr:hypothetical protein [Pseudomonadota bacterium]
MKVNKTPAKIRNAKMQIDIFSSGPLYWFLENPVLWAWILYRLPPWRCQSQRRSPQCSAQGVKPTVSDLARGFYDVTLIVTHEGGLTDTDEMMFSAIAVKVTLMVMVLAQLNLPRILDCR